MNNTMTLEEAIDFLAKNCPHVFAPISIEMQSLRETNEAVTHKVNRTEKALNELIFNTMNGGL